MPKLEKDEWIVKHGLGERVKEVIVFTNCVKKILW